MVINTPGGLMRDCFPYACRQSQTGECAECRAVAFVYVSVCIMVMPWLNLSLFLDSLLSKKVYSTRQL